jgi:putative transposase
MQLTQKIRIFPNKEQETLLWILSEKCRLIYNFALSERREAYSNGTKGINYYKQQNDLPEIKKKYPEYNWVYSHTLQYTLRMLNAEYSSFFSLNKKGDKDARPPRFKSKDKFSALVFNHGGFKVKDGFVSISHKHPSSTPLKFRIPEKFKFGKIIQVNLNMQNGDFYISITYEKNEKKYVDNGIYQAFDLGIIKQTAVNSKGKFTDFKNKRPDKYWIGSIADVQRKLSHCRRGSHRYNFYEKTLNRLQSKSANQLKDIQHKLSRKIIDNTKANTIIIGDLSVKDMAKKENIPKGTNFRCARSLHRGMQNTGSIARFVSFLDYKARLAGKKVIKINERDTSKTCCVCGKKKDMPLRERQYICDCGNNIDRDRNSAVNIMQRFLSQMPSGLATEFLGNLRTGVGV